MRKTSTILRDFEATANVWLASLESYSEHQFAMKPDLASWSIGQVYGHLVKGTRGFQLQQIIRCCEGTGADSFKGKTLAGKLTFVFGSFPPIRIKVPPSDSYTPAQPESIEAVRRGLTDLMAAMHDIGPKVASVSENQKTEHQALGFLNAREWFKLIEMHFRHHLRQKGRIDAFLKSQV
jgi:hypothetical protein